MKENRMQEVKDKLKRESEVAVRLLEEQGAKVNFPFLHCRRIGNVLISLAEQDDEICDAILGKAFSDVVCDVALAPAFRGNFKDIDTFLSILKHFYPGAALDVEIAVRINPEGADKPVGDGVTVNKRFWVFGDKAFEEERDKEVREGQG